MITPEQIDRYVNGNCSEDEIREIRKWCLSVESNPDYISSLDDEQRALLKQKLLQQINRNIAMEELGVSGRVIPYRWLNIAAAVVIVLGLTYLVKTYLPQYGSGKQSMQRVTNTGQNLMKLTLPDASTVWLYPGTAFEYGPFERDERKVTLIGEAFFEISRDTLRPFLIQSDDLTTKVLGTSFDIKAWPEDSIITVSVRTGKVALFADDDLLLTSNDQAVFSKATKSLKRKPGSGVSANKIWTTTSMAFRNTSLEEAADMLNDRFGVEISIANGQLANCTIWATFTDQHLATIIEAVCTSIEANYEITGNKIIISGPGCRSENDLEQAY